MKKRLFINSTSSMFLFLVNVAIAFVMSPIIVHSLGNRDYGIWEMLLSFCGYLGILELGLGPAIIRFVAKELALGNEEELNRIFNSALLGLFATGVGCLMAMALLSLAPSGVLNLKPGEVLHLQALCIIVGANLLVQFPGILFSCYLLGCQEHYLVNTFRIFFYIIQAAIVYLALTRWAGSGLLWIASISLGGNLVQYSAFALISFSRHKRLKLQKHFFSWESLKELYFFGFNSALLMVSDRIQAASLPLIIGHVLGASQVVYFAMPKRLAGYAKGLILSIGGPLMPYFSYVDAEREESQTLRGWFPLSRALSFVTFPVAATLFALGERFLHIWLGAEFAKEGRWVVIFLSISLFVYGLAPNATRILVAAGRHGPPAIRALIVSIATVVLSIILCSRWGVSGAVGALMLGEVTTVWISWWYASRYIGVSFSDHFRETVRPLLGPLLVIIACLGIGKSIFFDFSYSSLIKTGVISLICYLVSAWFMTINPVERQTLRLKAAKVKRAFLAQANPSSDETISGDKKS